MGSARLAHDFAGPTRGPAGSIAELGEPDP
jgi:hypothetical protein